MQLPESHFVFFKSGALHVKYVYPVFISAKIKAVI